MPGYDALHDSAAWLDISSRGRFRATGEDRQRLLHAIASNAVEDLTPGQGTYAFFLNAQGRIQSDSRIFVAENEVWIDCEPELRQALSEHIENYIIMDDVTVTDECDTVAALALEGPRSEEIAHAVLGEVLPEAEPNSTNAVGYSHRVSDGVRILRSTLSGQPGLWFFCAPSKAKALAQKFEAAGAIAASAEDIRVVRVENRRPRFGEDYSGANIPHETQLLQAVSFTKGCYLGQEIVERVRSRGQVNKLLSAIELDTKQPPPSGSAILYEGREAGQLSSPVFSPRAGKVFAFAILRREASDAGAEITVATDPGATEPAATEPASGIAGRVLGPPVC